MAYGESYEEFIAKFDKTAKKTTDDCYTPREIWEAVKEYVCNKYDITPEQIIRPFYPGGDYQKEEYKQGGVVVDNPPFSMVNKICTWYEERGIRYFLFTDGKRVTFPNAPWRTIIFVSGIITYENGAKILTNFVTNMEYGTLFRTEPVLSEKIRQIQGTGRNAKEIIIPGQTLSLTDAERLARDNVEFNLSLEEAFGAASITEKYRRIYSCLVLSDAATEKKKAALAEARRRKIERGAVEILEFSEEIEEKRKALK